MKPQDEPPSLERLKEDIRRLRGKTAPAASPRPQGRGALMRMGVDLASCVIVGAGMGILLDRWLGTSPVLCILCFLLGAGAGFRSIWRVSQAMEAEENTADDEK